MKKIKNILILIILSVLMLSCSKTDKLLNEDGKYVVYVNPEKDRGQKIVKIYLSDILIDSLNIPENKIIEMSNTLVNNAHRSAKNKLTYKLPESGMLFFMGKTKRSNECFIYGTIMGTAENSYGVRSNISSNIKFDLESNPIRNEYGLIIVSP